MLVTDIFRLSTRMFRTNRSRTLLTILGISVGIGAILFLVSLGYGLQKMILEQITTSDALLSLDVTSSENSGPKLDESAAEDILSIPEVAEISPLVSMQGQMTVNDVSSELVVNFADQLFFRLDGTSLQKGDFYGPDDQDDILISSAAMQLFNIDEDTAFGKKISFTLFPPAKEEVKTRPSMKIDREFEIAGIIDEENSHYVFMPYSILEKMDIEQFSKLKVKVASENQLNTARNRIIEKGYSVSALSDIIEQANQIFRIFQIILASFGIIALIVSAIGMFNTMTIALLERTQEIGVMKALGATSVDIWKMFLAESVIIGFFGGLGGIIIGLAGGEVFNYGINFLAGALGGQNIDIFYTPAWFIMLIISFSSIVGLLTGFYPAQRAAKINSLEALRYK